MREIRKDKILIAGYKFPHHSDSSGYHHLSSFIEGEFLDANRLPFGKAHVDSKIRQVNFILFELAIRLKALKKDVVHYLYPEQHLVFSVPKKNTIRVATIHLDEKWLDKNSKIKKKFLSTRRKAYEKLDGIICLSSEQASRLRLIYPEKKIRFIPHGINQLGYYEQCDYDRNERFLITIVGSNYRDKELLLEIIGIAAEKHKHWIFNLVGISQEWKKDFADFKNVIIHPFLSENEYFSVMQSSHIHLLPVKFATANNALLEAHTLGVPSLTSNTTGIKDYSIKSTRKFKGAFEAIRQLEDIAHLDNESYRQLRESTKKEAIKFSWEEITKEVLDFYKELKSNK
ncbi:glycosyltransferase family 4 protein [Cytobacillus oceanisediminis]|uniref:glycosyltransferase family 4 protein n=1 Tax=Cytobacillus oceanisediminis TaxID=665099 RepID=UPI001CC8EF21|nr:glycosyltransferase family 4 protein [Cytobacillus oceanisediminis]MBZ9537144.1 glycosyltransferase family 4 protein [Cytobacillus oceanisediminis]